MSGEADEIIREVERTPTPIHAGALAREPDEPPRRGGLQFKRPSGDGWHRKQIDEPTETRDDGKKSEKEPEESKPLTPLQRRKKIEKRLGRGYVGFAMFVKKTQGYPGDVLLSQSEEFVDSVMGIAEEKPRIMEWIESATEVGIWARFGGFCFSVSIPILAYYGYFPEEFVNFLVENGWLDVPPVPPEGEPIASSR
jgi:hypothetical protein